MNKENQISRRKAISGLGLSLAAVAISPIMSAQGSITNSNADPGKLVDPTTKYPRPPFKGQIQTWPGLASQMDPKPDHGETSYKGSGRLKGR